MKFITHSHRHAEKIISSDSVFTDIFDNFINVLSGISDEDLCDDFYIRLGKKRGKSLSKSINHLIKVRLEYCGWSSETKIFKPNEYANPWRLDFTKGPFSVEIAFNHGEATAWNLMKPVIASEINHVEKEFQTELGIVVFATKEMKKKGGFDNTIKTFEDMDNFLLPLMNYLTIPILIIGLKEPESFEIKHIHPNPSSTTKLGMIYKGKERVVRPGEEHLIESPTIA